MRDNIHGSEPIKGVWVLRWDDSCHNATDIDRRGGEPCRCCAEKHKGASREYGRPSMECINALRQKIQPSRFNVTVLGATADEKPRKYTVECTTRDDAMLVAFALDGGWTRGEAAEEDASGMLELAKMYCEVTAETQADATR